MSLLLARRRPLLFPTDAAAAGYADEVLADNPLAYWRFEETSGSIVADEVGSNDGTVFGANLNVLGASGTGSAASFDGTDDYITVPDAAALNAPLSAITLEAIMEPDHGGEARVLLNKYNAGGTARYYEIVLLATGEMNFTLGHNSGAGFAQARTAALTKNTQHLACRWDKNQNGGALQIFINGVETSYAQTASLTADISPNTEPLRIGTNTSANDAFYRGMIDEPAVYDHALTEARILAHAQAAGVA